MEISYLWQTLIFPLVCLIVSLFVCWNFCLLAFQLFWFLFRVFVYFSVEFRLLVCLNKTLLLFLVMTDRSSAYFGLLWFVSSLFIRVFGYFILLLILFLLLIFLWMGYSANKNKNFYSQQVYIKTAVVRQKDIKYSI